MAEWQRARLIPVSGIGSEQEAEVRATSALLAVVEAVRDLSIGMFSPFGASKAVKADVRCFTEVPFKLGPEKTASRPDGLVQIIYGESSWTALIEVKTGSATLNADQINAYWDVAREQGFDTVITISNEIAPSKGLHPTEGLKVRSNSKVQVHHYSWTALLSMCDVIRDHRGVDDPDQAWILGELIRYLRHRNSGVTAFDDMGPEWVGIRDGARDASLHKTDPAVRDIAKRWDQLLRYAALRLEAVIGQPVAQQLPSNQREPAKRLQHLIDQLAGPGQLDGVLRIPNTVGDLEIGVDLRARRITAAVSVPAPDDRGGRARCTWIVNQLDGDVDTRLLIESFARNARTPMSATLAAAREDKDVLIGPDKKDPARFRLSLTREMGAARKGGRKATGFIDATLLLITDFYGMVVQDLTPWTPRAPKISRPKVRSDLEGPESDQQDLPDTSPAATPPPVPATSDVARTTVPVTPVAAPPSSGPAWFADGLGTPTLSTLTDPFRGHGR